MDRGWGKDCTSEYSGIKIRRGTGGKDKQLIVKSLKEASEIVGVQELAPATLSKKLDASASMPAEVNDHSIRRIGVFGATK
jgi:hypothetical protein